MADRGFLMDLGVSGLIESLPNNLMADRDFSMVAGCKWARRMAFWEYDG